MKKHKIRVMSTPFGTESKWIEVEGGRVFAISLPTGNGEYRRLKVLVHNNGEYVVSDVVTGMRITTLGPGLRGVSLRKNVVAVMTSIVDQTGPAQFWSVIDAAHGNADAAVS